MGGSCVAGAPAQPYWRLGVIRPAAWKPRGGEGSPLAHSTPADGAVLGEGLAVPVIRFTAVGT
eukprot:9750168-Prorocentrum_lima.AAC.1